MTLKAFRCNQFGFLPELFAVNSGHFYHDLSSVKASIALHAPHRGVVVAFIGPVVQKYGCAIFRFSRSSFCCLPKLTGYAQSFCTGIVESIMAARLTKTTTENDMPSPMWRTPAESQYCAGLRTAQTFLHFTSISIDERVDERSSRRPSLHDRRALKRISCSNRHQAAGRFAPIPVLAPKSRFCWGMWP
jgi:hypothetical protein